jgi:hypothetical protein
MWLDQLRDFYLKKLNGIWDSEGRHAIVHAPNRDISSADGPKFKGDDEQIASCSKFMRGGRTMMTMKERNENHNIGAHKSAPYIHVTAVIINGYLG